jgi:phospholipid-binding lipoprotein MlaA
MTGSSGFPRLHPILILVLFACLVLPACATPPKDPAQRAVFEQNNDPLEPMNRAIFAFNDAAYTYVIFPVARTYNVLPEPARTGVHNALANLNEPIVFMNKGLQGDFSSALAAVGRFVMNSIFGFGGLIDVAAHNDLQEPQAGDFGATLYTYGIGEGPYLVLPLLGPSNPRDTIGLVADGEASPWGYILYTTYPEQIGMFAITGLDKLDRQMDSYNESKRTSLDFYAFLRSAYRQNRRFELSYGKDTGTENFYQDPSAAGDHP